MSNKEFDKNQSCEVQMYTHTCIIIEHIKYSRGQSVEIKTFLFDVYCMKSEWWLTWLWCEREKVCGWKCTVKLLKLLLQLQKNKFLHYVTNGYMYCCMCWTIEPEKSKCHSWRQPTRETRILLDRPSCYFPFVGVPQFYCSGFTTTKTNSDESMTWNVTRLNLLCCSLHWTLHTVGTMHLFSQSGSSFLDHSCTCLF